MPSNDRKYSIDASAMIELDKTYPIDLFPSMWDFLGRLAEEGKLLICTQAAKECKDPAVTHWLAQHPQIVIPFDSHINQYANALHRELAKEHLWLVNPNSDKNQADPFVISLALLLENRDLADLRKQPINGLHCIVIQYEGSQKANQQQKFTGRVRIPVVCGTYHLDHFTWVAVLRQEGWKHSR